MTGTRINNITYIGKVVLTLRRRRQGVFGRWTSICILVRYSLVQIIFLLISIRTRISSHLPSNCLCSETWTQSQHIPYIYIFSVINRLLLLLSECNRPNLYFYWQFLYNIYSFFTEYWWLPNAQSHSLIFYIHIHSVIHCLYKQLIHGKFGKRKCLSLSYPYIYDCIEWMCWPFMGLQRKYINPSAHKEDIYIYTNHRYY